ncbi:hypothetical protein CPB83DRAFT_802647 [Crepidotus variabilis]|uniref:RRM domain-containing protein n=1 Tax=Crepidotus variabilis TaxID=179855 RepID=A0A9P6ESI6_9AGAR|nr:hypothetical protein CPB83DRAFT_802647 [Crepidotus variabilis]
MNVVKEINKINEKELELGLNGASWHDEYKDSAYIFVGGLNTEMSEGDVITIFSQYGEIMDANMPRDKETGQPKGFAFVMYEDQRSTVLAVDNLNGAQVLGRTLRVDHVKNYRQAKVKNDEGEWVEPDEQSFNAKPEMIVDSGGESEASASTGASIDPEDPMRDYLIEQRKEAKALHKKKIKGKNKRQDETPEERQARKARKQAKKEKRLKSAGVKGVEDLLKSIGGRKNSAAPSDSRRRAGSHDHKRSPSPRRRERSLSQEKSSQRREREDRRARPLRHSDEEDDSQRYRPRESDRSQRDQRR